MRGCKKFIILFSILFLSNKIAYVDIPEKVKDKYLQVGFLIENEKYEDAVQLGKEILNNYNKELNDYAKSRLFNNIGFCYYKLGKYEEAYDFYLKALETDQNYLLCLNNISAVLIKLKRYQEAIKYLEKALVLNNNNVKVIFNLFVVYAHLKNVEMAKSYLKMALRIDRGYTIKRLKSNGISDKKIAEIQKFLEDN